MKRILSLQLLILFVLSITYSCTSKQSDEPEAVLSSFKKMYPAATNAKWENLKDSIFTVAFKADNKEMLAIYNSSGDWLKSVTTVTHEQIAAVVIAKIEDFYKGYSIKRSRFIETPDLIGYEINIEVMNKKIELLISETGDLRKAKAVGIITEE